MKKLPIPAVILGFTALLASCEEGGLCLKGEGDVETRTLVINDIEEVNVSGSPRVFITKGEQQRVEVKGQANVLDELETEVNGGVWDVTFRRCLRDHEPVEVYITVPELTAASVGGSGYLELQDVFESGDFDASVSGSGDMRLQLDTDHLSSRISGSGTITAAGEANRHDLSISGSGNNNSFELRSEEAVVDISGSGQAEVNVRRSLNVDISGSGRVYHKGNPKVNADVSGSGKVISE